MKSSEGLLEWTVPILEADLHLRRLDITGFKSFSKPIRFELRSGITALVGANGSGKSNVVDAIRWCLGEQSARDLRTQRAEDLIYAGPRRAVGAAEVCLTFEADDEARDWLELAVSRRLYRSGESEYLVNRKRSRLRDVADELRGIGIDSARNVIINQGMADFFLTASPVERRGLLEQAAGLSGYRQRREEALQKLATAGQNLQMVEAVIAEIEPRVRSLRRQARAFEDREQVRERLEAALRALFASRWRSLSCRESELLVRTASLRDTRLGLERRLEELERNAERSLEGERAWQRDVDAAVEELAGAARRRDAISRENQRLEAELASAQSALADLEDASGRLRQAERGSRERLAQGLASLDELRTSRARSLGARKDAQACVESLAIPHGEAASSLEQVRTALSAVEERLDDARRSAERCRVRHDWAVSRLRGIAAGVRELEHAQARLEDEISQASLAVADSEGQASAAEATVQATRLASIASSQRLDRLQGLIRLVRSAERETEARLATANKVVKGLAGERDVAPLAGLVVPVGWERAVACAFHLGGDQALDPQEASSSLHGFEAWRRGLSAAIGQAGIWADSMVRGDGRPIVQLQAALFVERPDDAAALWRRLAPLPAYSIGSPLLRVVSRDGQCWSALGDRVLPAQERAEIYLLRRQESERLGKRRRILGTRFSRLEQALLSQQRAGTELASQLEAQKTRVGERSRLVSEQREALDNLERRRKQSSQDLARLRQELETLKGEVTSSQDTLEETQGRVRTLQLERDTLHGLWRRASQEAEEIQQQLSSALRAQDEARQGLEVADAKLAAREAVIAAAQAELDRVEGEMHLMNERRTSLLCRQDEAQKALSAARPRLAGLEEVAAHGEATLDALRRRRPAQTVMTGSLRQTRAELGDIVGRHERAIAELAALGRERAEVEAQARSELGVEAWALPEPPPEVPSEEDLRKLRVRAALYSDTDASVVAEWREAENRRVHLRSQHDDLSSACASLQEVISASDREMEQRFDRAFRDVNEEFSRVYQMMFGGGDAWLEQTGEERGIEVRAHLPGRRTRSSAAFSGGEKSLVATSLLFAVLRIRPTPFLVLDEVDAALDESNVDRFLVALRDISERTQIIIVTHNRATMAAADVLYGLTMDGEGSSSALSLRLETYPDAV